MNPQTVSPVSISRDGRRRDVNTETSPVAAKPEFHDANQGASPSEKELPAKAGRREFMQTVLPASGKLLASFFRNVTTTIAAVSEDAKAGRSALPKKSRETN